MGPLSRNVELAPLARECLEAAALSVAALPHREADAGGRTGRELHHLAVLFGNGERTGQDDVPDAIGVRRLCVQRRARRRARGAEALGDDVARLVAEVGAPEPG